MPQDLSKLAVWQAGFYTETADLWSVDQHLAVDGRDTGETYTRRYTNVVCGFEEAQYIDEPRTVTRGRGFSIRRASIFWTTADQELGRMWIVVRTTPGPNRLKGYRIGEEPVIFPSVGVFDMNSRSAHLDIIDKLPPAILATYGS